MIKVIIHRDIRDKLKNIRLLCFDADVKVGISKNDFREEANRKIEESRGRLRIEDISQIPTNHATREAYKILGKDPSRYRPSAEALLRRVINGKALYQVNNVVDCLNLISISTGYSIGGFDKDLIKGEVFLSIGDQSEYQAIGRGALNIENLPALFDESGPFGTPTSDSVRTMVTEKTSRLLMVVYDFGTNDSPDNIEMMIKNYLLTYCESKETRSFTVL